MRNTLIDAGPIIALFDRGDKYHNRIVNLIKQESFHLISTWPVITEASHMLDFDNRAQISLLEWIYRGGLELTQIDASGIRRIIELTKKYNDIPMDLADATLIVAAEKLGIREIISIDNDFYIYRTIQKEMITNIFKQ
ncbi:MAG: PIN domain-containing protein [Spirochaetales bacterium]|nr:PIN domain-containing protein [Spirochaetales bacterium]